MRSSEVTDQIKQAARLIHSAKYLTAFTGAGISVESGIPPFRGPGGLWGKYDPETLQIEYFLRNPAAAWPTIKEIFYDNFGKAKPNKAHEVLARLEIEGWPRGGAGAAAGGRRAECGAGLTDGASGGSDAGGERAGARPASDDARGHLKVLITQNIDSVQ